MKCKRHFLLCLFLISFILIFYYVLWNQYELTDNKWKIGKRLSIMGQSGQLYRILFYKFAASLRVFRVGPIEPIEFSRIWSFPSQMARVTWIRLKISSLGSRYRVKFTENLLKTSIEGALYKILFKISDRGRPCLDFVSKSLIEGVFFMNSLENFPIEGSVVQYYGIFS